MVEVKNDGKIVLNGVDSNFNLKELVPKQVYNYFGVNAIWFLDPDLLHLLQFMRIYFEQSMKINDWSYGGTMQYRGFRPDPFYYDKQEDGTYKDKRKGKYSQHRYGRAIDCSFSKMSAEEARQEIMANEEMWLDAGLTTIEDGAYSPTWLHFDIRNTGLNNIKVVKP